MLTLKRLLGAALTALVLLLTACQSPLNITQNHAAARDVTLSGSSGTISVTNMTNTSLTVTYSPGTQYTSVQLYLSQGNGTGLVLAAQNMNFSAGTYSYTFSNASYTSGALIYVALEQNNNGVETTLPSGSLSNVATWMSFTYAASSPTPTPTASPTPTPTSSGLTVSGANGSLEITNMTAGNLTVTYAPSASISSAALYVSQGNGTGLVVANQPMTNTSGTWTATCSNASFTSGAVIFVDVLTTANGVQTNVPQGNLSNVTSWASFTYASAPSPSPSPSPSPTPGNLTVSGVNGTLTLTNMTAGNLTVSYAPSAAISSAFLYVSQGNGTGLVVANSAMTNTNGNWSATCTNATFVAGAQIYVDVLVTANGVQTNVPQGTLSNVTSWASFTYAATPTPTPTPTPSPTPTPTPSPITSTGDPWYGGQLLWDD
ncbi:MAG: hypothetical protein HKM05_06180, partial [Spirochaetales bacterium]|nr:hypothetical protein [Spirochaetales bacterium]